jgi:hypothetical protein
VSTQRHQQGGLSVTTLAISAAASVAAAIVVHEVWKGGAIVGAAVTPVIVAIVSESLRKPVDRVTVLREERRTRTQVRPGQAPPPPPTDRADPFGIWQDERRPWWMRRSTKLAVITGLLAFVIGAFVLTGTELIFGDSVGSGGSSTSIFGGGSKKRSSDEKTSTTDTQTQTETAPTETVPPAETTPTAPSEATPPPTQQVPVPPTPTEPAPTQTAPPAETAPAPAPAPTP